MAWENRQNGRYYYKKRRVGDHVISEYIGSGFLAETEARLTDLEKRQAAEARQAWQDKVKSIQAIEQQLGQIEEQINNLVKAELLASGYHPHKGQWRKVRNGNRDRNTTVGTG
jgi:hypothetical protein